MLRAPHSTHHTTINFARNHFGWNFSSECVYHGYRIFNYNESTVGRDN